jgi:hypothetical protein
MIVIFILLLIAGFCPYPADNHWVWQQLEGFIAILSGMSYCLCKKYHWSVALLFLISSLWGLFQYFFPYGLFTGITRIEAAQWGSSICGATMTTLLFAIPFISLDRKYLDKLMSALYWIFGLDALIMIAKACLFGSQSAWYLFVHPSVDSSVIACILPAIISLKKKEEGVNFIFLTLGFMAIYLGHSSTAMACLGVGTIAYYLSKKRSLKPLLLVPVAAGIAWVFLQDKLLESDGRFYEWKLQMHYWWEHLNRYIGAGPGTFFILGPRIQFLSFTGPVDPHYPIFFWLHNDWLQVLWEQGIVGFVSLVMLYLFMLKKSFNRPWLFSMVCAYGFMGLTQFPLRLFFMQLFGCALVYECFKITTEEERDYGRIS